MEADGRGLSGGKGNSLRIRAGTAIQRIDAAVRVTQFLDIDGSGSQSGDGDLSAGIGSMRSGNECGTGSIRINPELPSGQIQAILGSLGQTQSAKIQLVIEANKEVIDQYQNSFIDQQFGMDTFVPKRVYYNKDYKLSDIASEMPMEKRTMKIDYTK